mgnify:CR=1 FL=1
MEYVSDQAGNRWHGKRLMHVWIWRMARRGAPRAVAGACSQGMARGHSPAASDSPSGPPCAAMITTTPSSTAASREVREEDLLLPRRQPQPPAASCIVSEGARENAAGEGAVCVCVELWVRGCSSSPLVMGADCRG